LVARAFIRGKHSPASAKAGQKYIKFERFIRALQDFTVKPITGSVFAVALYSAHRCG